MPIDFILIPLVVMLAPVLIVAMLLVFQLKRAKLRTRLLLELADKGVAITPQLLTEPRSDDADRRRGLVLIFAGLGVMAMCAAMPVTSQIEPGLRGLWGIGLLPLLIGLGYLLNWWLGRHERRHD
jgi:TctA family transporter